VRNNHVGSGSKEQDLFGEFRTTRVISASLVRTKSVNGVKVGLFLEMMKLEDGYVVVEELGGVVNESRSTDTLLKKNELNSSGNFEDGLVEGSLRVWLFPKALKR
jgi:hypothetical protein